MRPKKKLDQLLKDCTKQFKEFSTRGKELICTVGEIEVKYDPAHFHTRVKEHLQSNLHKKNATIRSQQPRIDVALSRVDHLQRHEIEFRLELCTALISADIPLDKLNNKLLKAFLEKISRQKIPSIRTLRRTTETVYDNIIGRIRETIGDNNIYMVIDETTDILDRMQVNFLVGCLDGRQSKPMLVYVDFIERANSHEMNKLFLKCCKYIRPIEDVPYERIQLFLSDQAPYMVKAVQLMKVVAPEAFHITCVAHAFHRVAEKLRELHQVTDKFIGKFKEILRGNKRRKRQYIEETGLPCPPKAIITRWCTWLNAAKYFCDHYQKVKDFLKDFKSDAVCVQECKELILDDDFRRELYQLSDYFFLVEVINKLETQNLRLDDALQIVGEAFVKVDTGKSEGARQKIRASFHKNPDYHALFDIEDVTKRVNFKFAPITTCDVERSFSRTKSILDADRASFTEGNLKQNYIINYNSFMLNIDREVVSI